MKRGQGKMDLCKVDSRNYVAYWVRRKLNYYREDAWEWDYKVPGVLRFYKYGSDEVLVLDIPQEKYWDIQCVISDEIDWGWENILAKLIKKFG